MRSKVIQAADLFCGAGGTSTGLKLAVKVFLRAERYQGAPTPAGGYTVRPLVPVDKARGVIA
jgi:hypothetical protein